MRARHINGAWLQLSTSATIGLTKLRLRGALSIRQQQLFLSQMLKFSHVLFECAYNTLGSWSMIPYPRGRCDVSLPEGKYSGRSHEDLRQKIWFDIRRFGRMIQNVKVHHVGILRKEKLNTRCKCFHFQIDLMQVKEFLENNASRYTQFC